jgi:hypothetical protein
LDKEDFVKKSLALEPAQEKKFGSMWFIVGKKIVKKYIF